MGIIFPITTARTVALTALLVVAPVFQGEAISEEGAMDRQPLELVLTTTSEPGLRAVLRNRSDREQTVLVFPYRFPSLLTLTDASGHQIAGINPRVIEKPRREAWIVHRDYYQRLSPGGEIEIAREQFYSRPIDQGTWQLTWDRIRFGNLAPGVYRVRVSRECQVDSWEDEKTGKSGQMPGVWKGRVESNEGSVSLPPPPHESRAEGRSHGQGEFSVTPEDSDRYRELLRGTPWIFQEVIRAQDHKPWIDGLEVISVARSFPGYDPHLRYLFVAGNRVFGEKEFENVLSSVSFHPQTDEEALRAAQLSVYLREVRRKKTTITFVLDRSSLDNLLKAHRALAREPSIEKKQGVYRITLSAEVHYDFSDRNWVPSAPVRLVSFAVEVGDHLCRIVD